MDTSIIVAIITSGVSLAGIILSNIASNNKIEETLKTQQAVTDTKLEQLTKQVEKHNQVVERVYKLEQANAVEEEEIKVANNRILDLEKINERKN